MANLVAPVNILEPVEERMIEFKGLNRNPVVEDGEMSDMKNLSPDRYPLLAPRPLRGTYTMPPGAVQPLQMMTRFERIAMIAKKSNGNVAFFYHLTEVTNVTGLTENTKMVAINNKICFFPQNTYLEIVRTGSVVQTGAYGSLSASNTVTGASASMTLNETTITFSGASNYKPDDAVRVNGTLTYTVEVESESTVNNETVTTTTTETRTADCDVYCVVEDQSGNNLVLPRDTFIELVGEGGTLTSFTGTISRSMPIDTFHHVIEWNNRLWGVNNLTNTIYACKLGDPTNWMYYQGTSLDSYAAEQGSDEDWTGCAGYSGHIIFFKQNSMTRIYGSAPSNFQISNTQCFGVEQGSSDSIVVVNDTVFYKSTVGIMAYDGGTPYCISDKFNMKFKNVVGGTEGHKYYASVQKEDNTYELLVLDIDKGVWHREDTVRFRDTCTLDGRLYFICDSSTGSFTANKVYIINPATASESYSNLDWMATFGPFDEYIEERKIYSKLSLRLMPVTTSYVSVYISINEGAWELVKSYSPVQKGGEFIPIIPRRCDRYSIKITGTGNCAIKSLTRRIRMGTGGKL